MKYRLFIEHSISRAVLHSAPCHLYPERPLAEHLFCILGDIPYDNADRRIEGCRMDITQWAAVPRAGLEGNAAGREGQGAQRVN
jgi:hypothetical protein